MDYATFTPEQIRRYAEANWPCESPDHEQIIERDGWCAYCGRASPESFFAGLAKEPRQGTWEHEGQFVAFLAKGMLFVDQETYERASGVETNRMVSRHEVVVKHSNIISGLQAEIRRPLTQEEMGIMDEHIERVMAEGENHWAFQEGQTLAYVVLGVSAAMFQQ